jgi:segregation and condensation protein A
MFSVQLKIYEGPLDLMLDGITHKKLNIFDIDLSAIIDCFIEYIATLRDNGIDAAAEFIEYAARLIYIKTALLLPRHKDEAEGLKKELEGRLIDRALCVETGKLLAAMYKGAVIFTRKPLRPPSAKEYNIEHDVSWLYACYKDALGTRSAKDIKSAEEPPHVHAPPKFTPIFTMVVYILRKLAAHGVFPMNELYTGKDRIDQSTIFLALLDLLKCGRIELKTYDDSKTQYLELVRDMSVYDYKEETPINIIE